MMRLLLVNILAVVWNKKNTHDSAKIAIGGAYGNIL